MFKQSDVLRYVVFCFKITKKDINFELVYSSGALNNAPYINNLCPASKLFENDGFGADHSDLVSLPRSTGWTSQNVHQYNHWKTSKDLGDIPWSYYVISLPRHRWNVSRYFACRKYRKHTNMLWIFLKI